MDACRGNGIVHVSQTDSGTRFHRAFAKESDAVFPDSLAQKYLDPRRRGDLARSDECFREVPACVALGHCKLPSCVVPARVARAPRPLWHIAAADPPWN